MKELSTIQKREKLNDVYALDEKGNGGANHKFGISTKDEPSIILATLQFQNGARKDSNSTHGILDQDLLEITRCRLQGFQSGEFPTRETAMALTCLEEALMWMNRRIEDRIERNVLGTNVK